MVNALEEVRFPLSPYEEGIAFVIDRVMDESEETTQSWKEGDSSVAASYVSELGPKRMAEIGLHPALASRPDFVAGVARAIYRIPELSEQADQYLKKRSPNE